MSDWKEEKDMADELNQVKEKTSSILQVYEAKKNQIDDVFKALNTK